MAFVWQNQEVESLDEAAGWWNTTTAPDPPIWYEQKGG